MLVAVDRRLRCAPVLVIVALQKVVTQPCDMVHKDMCTAVELAMLKTLIALVDAVQLFFQCRTAVALLLLMVLAQRCGCGIMYHDLVVKAEPGA